MERLSNAGLDGPQSSPGLSSLFLVSTAEHGWDGVGVGTQGVVRKGIVSLDSSKEVDSWSAPCRPYWGRCSASQPCQSVGAPLVCGSGCQELLPYFWTFVGALSKQRGVLPLSTRISFPPAIFFYFTHRYCSHTLLYIVKHKQKPYVMSIMVICKRVAVCLGEQGSSNLLLCTVWSLSVQ